MRRCQKETAPSKKQGVERFVEIMDEMYQSCGPDLAEAVGGEWNISKEDILNLAVDNSEEGSILWFSFTDEEQAEAVKEFRL